MVVIEASEAVWNSHFKKGNEVCERRGRGRRGEIVL
jgi:hypothetical protein